MNDNLNTVKESKFIEKLLIIISIFFVFIMLIIPVFAVIFYSLKDGIEAYKNAVFDEYTIKALKLTINVVIITVIFNTIFGLFASFLLTKFEFKGKQFLMTLIDIPFAISPVIAGLVFTLTFGRIGWANSFLEYFDIQILFALPGILLATIFVTFPFISREIIPVLNAQGKDEEEAAALMGASALRIFTKITLPNIKWALLYGIVLCSARAMGEFGAVSVISGHLRGKTTTLPLHIEILYNEFNKTSAFAVSSILLLLAIIILIIRNILEHKSRREL